MNNQVKLIDADKVFRWAELCVIPVRAEDIRRAYELGLFDPDTPPVPTIKPGDKVRSFSKPGLGIGIVVDPKEEGLYEFSNRTWVRFGEDDLPLHTRTSDLEVVE